MNNDGTTTTSRRNRPRSGGQGKGPLIKKIIGWTLSICLLIFVALAALFFFWASSAPTISESALKSQSTTTIYDDSDKVISRLGAQKREYASQSEIPATLKNAVVAIEDRRFYKHHGIDPVRIGGSAIADIFHRSNGMQGGSTLTQQLVKLTVFSTSAKDQTLKRKAQEAWLALNVERHFSKQDILKFYINKVYMGNGVYGMKTAAQYYYGKDLDELDLAQLATLAGIPQSPTYYNPAVDDTKYATQRRNQVLDAMVRSKYITAAQAKSAKAENITSGLDEDHGNTSENTTGVKEKIVDAYVKEVLAQLQAQGYNVNTDGLKVHTNLDLAAQEELYNAANSGVAFQNDSMQTGVAVTDPHNGQVVAMLGGRKIDDNVIYGLNRAVQSNRSSGSTAKPIMDYGPAIEYLHWPTYKALSDTKFYWPGTSKALHDWDNKYKGTMTMRSALVQSRNVPAIRALQDVGLSRATTFLKGLGITPGKNGFNLQNGIGLYVSPLQMSAAYAAFANGGTYYKPYYISSITTQDGKTITFDKHGKRAMTKATAYMITDMLKGVFTDSNGTATDANLSGVHQAGKTGTDEPMYGTSGVMDSWMVGYTKNYSVAVWTGFDNPKYAVAEGYEKSAHLLYKAIMSFLDGQNHASDWTMPDTVEAISYSGHRELVIRDSKWAFGFTEMSSTSHSSSASSLLRSSSASSEKESTDSASSSSQSSSASSASSASASAPSTPAPNNNQTQNSTATNTSNGGGAPAGQ